MNVEHRAPSPEDWLPNHWLFAGTPRHELAALIAATCELRFMPGDVVFHEGDAADGLYLLAAGAVRVAATTSEGDTALATVSANDLFGEIGVLDGEPRSGTATAIGVSTAYFLPAEAFLDVLERAPTVGMRLLAHLVLRLRRTNGRLADLPASAAIVPAVTEAAWP